MAAKKTVSANSFKRPPTKARAKKVKLVAFKDVRAFARAAVEKKLPRGISVVIGSKDTIVHAKHQATPALRFGASPSA